MANDAIETHTMAVGLADQLKARTWALHREAERSGILHELLRGRAGVDGYVLLLRNLVPVYDALEQALTRLSTHPLLGALARPEVYRGEALRSDLRELAGPRWIDTVPMLPAAERYAQQISAAAIDADLLVPHAYVRYLGDVNGGQILKRLLGKSLGLTADQLAFYDFSAVGDLHGFSRDFREAIDRIGEQISDHEPILQEAAMAFRLNIELSAAVEGTAPPQTAALATV